MISIYNSYATNFDNNGNVLTPTSCVVKEELNGTFELELTHVFDYNNKWKYILPFSIVKANTPRGPQLFRIYEVTYKKTSTSNFVVAFARHIFYDNLQRVHTGISATCTSSSALSQLFSEFSDFTTSSDITDSVKLDTGFGNLVELIMGDNGLLNAYSGYLERDNFNVSIKSSIGATSNVHLRYGKNIKGITYEIETEDIVTKFLPICYNDKGTSIFLPEKYVVSENSSLYHDYLTAIREYTDIDTSLSTTQMYTLMRERVETELSNGVDLPSIYVLVDFANADNLESLELNSISIGDIIRVYYPPLNLDVNATCVKYSYDSCQSKLKTIELGKRKKDFSDHFRDMNSGLISLASNYKSLQWAVDDILVTINPTTPEEENE